MKKYAIPGMMLVFGHEVISLLALIIASVMFLSDIAAEAAKKGV